MSIQTLEKQDFDNAVSEVEARLEIEVKTKIQSLETMFEKQLEEGKTEVCAGMIKCINAIDSQSTYHILVKLLDAGILTKMNIETRERNGISFGKVYLSIWELFDKIDSINIRIVILMTGNCLEILPTPEKMAKLYKAAIMNVSHNLYFDEKYSLIIERLRCMISFLQRAAWTDLVGYTITLTGSDPHMHGRQVLFVEKDGKKLVYKPRSMVVDNLLGGMNGFLQFINELMPHEKYHLPCIKIDEYQEEDLTYGMEEYVNKCYEFTSNEAEDYYRKMGVLAYLAKIAGVTDLHQDNIMPTKQGPVILDAECTFLYHVLTSDNMNATLISGALRDRSNAFGDDAISFIMIEGKDATSYQNAWQYYPVFIEGYCMAYMVCMDNKEQVAEKFVNLVKQKIVPVRLVPINTSEFAVCMEKFFSDKAEAVNLCAKSIMEHLQKSLKIEEFDEDMLKVQLEDSFRHGDIPLIQVNVALGAEKSEVLINHLVFAHTYVYSDEQFIKAAINFAIQYMGSKSNIEIMQAFLPRLIKKEETLWQ